MCIAHEMEAAIAKILKYYGVSSTQLSILDALDNSELEVITVNQLKGYMLDESPNVSRSLNKLMENKLIIKERDLIDQRGLLMFKLVKKVHFNEPFFNLH